MSLVQSTSSCCSHDIFAQQSVYFFFIYILMLSVTHIYFAQCIIYSCWLFFFFFLFNSFETLSLSGLADWGFFENCFYQSTEICARHCGNGFLNDHCVYAPSQLTGSEGHMR